MRRMCFITLSLSLIIILNFTQLSVAKGVWTEYPITNRSAQTIHVTFSTWRVADANVLETGYRTVGTYTIAPGGSHKFYAYKDNVIYFRILDSSKVPIKPMANTATVSSFVFGPALRDFDLNFNIVIPKFLNGDSDISFMSISSPKHPEIILDVWERFFADNPQVLPLAGGGLDVTHPVRFDDGFGFFREIITEWIEPEGIPVHEPLVSIGDGFMRYRNGEQITVTDAWVLVPLIDDPPPVDFNGLDGNGLTDDDMIDDDMIDDQSPFGDLVDDDDITYSEEFLVDVGMWCATEDPAHQGLHSTREVRSEDVTRLYAVGQKSKFWTPEDTVFSESTPADGVVLTVRFLNGTPAQKDRVKELVPRWAEAEKVGLRFEFIEGDHPSDIRIEFIESDKRSWSWLGTDAKKYPGKPTMGLSPPGEPDFEKFVYNYYNPDDPKDRDPSLPFSGVILHEFGHALGLMHEQSSPSVQLENVFDSALLRDVVKKDKIKKGLVEPQLSEAVDEEMHQYEAIASGDIHRYNYTVFDPDSIMLYSGLPYTQDFLNRFREGEIAEKTEFVYQLSELDKEFIHGVYPKYDSTPVDITATPSLLSFRGDRDGDSYTVETKTAIDFRFYVYNKDDLLINGIPITLSTDGAADIRLGATVLNTGADGAQAQVTVTVLGRNESGRVKMQAGQAVKYLNFDVKGRVIQEINSFTKSVTFKSRRGNFGDCVLTAGAGRDWYWTSTKTLDFTDECEERVSYTVEADPGPWGNDPDGDANYVKWEYFKIGNSRYNDSVWWDGDKVMLKARIREWCLDPTTLKVSVTVECKSEILVAAPSLQVQLTPGTDHLSTVWQELSHVPSETALLPNYPNPFNPETWIPYHLAEPAEVTFSIYSMDGKLIRTLALGYQSAGAYESKSRAVYWDGRNAVGERVASGLYFYTLIAGDFAATGKMLILK